MATELSITAALSGTTTGVLGFSQAEAESFTADLTVGTGVFVRGTMATSTSAAAIPMGAIVTASWALFKNLDSTNSIKIRIGASGADVVKLAPGESAVFRLAASNPYAISTASTPQLRYFIVGANA